MLVCAHFTEGETKTQEANLSKVTQLVSRKAGVQVQPNLEPTLFSVPFTERAQRKLITDYRKIMVMAATLVRLFIQLLTC